MILILMVFAVAVVLIVTLEIVFGIKRGGIFSGVRAITVAAAAVLAAITTFVLAKIFITEKYISVPAELIPLIKELVTFFAVPVVALVLYGLFKLLTLIAYAIIKSSLLKGKYAVACTERTSKSSALGVAGAAVIIAITAAFFALPCIRGAALYKDYKANEANFSLLMDLAMGKKVSNADLINTADELSSYLLDTDYISDENKVLAINYGINQANKIIASQGHGAISNITLETYDTLEEHKQQVEAIVDVAKTLEETGILDAVTGEGGNAGETVSTEKILNAMTNEETASNFIGAMCELDNGGQMLAGVINETVQEMSNGEIKAILNEAAFENLEANKDAIVQTLLYADCFTNLSKESYSQMNEEEKKDLINKLETIKSYGVLNEQLCNTLIYEISTTIK